MTVWVYSNGKIIKVFATQEAAQIWFDTNALEGVAFEQDVEDEPSLDLERG
jgi:hypothetical protein